MCRLLLIPLLTLVLLSNAGASVIFGPQQTAGGKTVDLGGLEWLSLTETEGQSRDAVDMELGTGGTFYGWRIATRGETETLLDSLWGGSSEGYSPDNFDGARWFIDSFGLGTRFDAIGNGGYREDGLAFWDFSFGLDGECAVLDSVSCQGHVEVFDATFHNSNPGYSVSFSTDQGFFRDEFGLSDGDSPGNSNDTTDSSYSSTNTGVLLVRSSMTTVPIPASIWLFGPALVFMFRKRITVQLYNALKRRMRIR